MLWKVIGLSEVASFSCLQLIKAVCPCIFKWPWDQLEILVGRGEIRRDWCQCDLIVGKDNKPSPPLQPSWTPLVLRQRPELLAYSSSVFLSIWPTYGEVQCPVHMLIWYLIFIFFFRCTEMAWLKPGLRDAWPAVTINFEGCFSPLTWQVRRDRIESLSYLL